MAMLEFCSEFVYLNRQPISFADRPYLPAIYAARRNLILRCSRQTEKTTFLANTILYTAINQPGIRILFVSPRTEQARVFAHTRLSPSLLESPVIRRSLLGRSARKPPISNMTFKNGSQVFLRAAYRSADAARGLSADLLLVDEFQDIAPGDLPVLQETLSHAKNGRTILTGTPKLCDNHLDAIFDQSTANEWTVVCPGCSKPVIFDERCLGPRETVCPHCQTPVDPRAGHWTARNPEAVWGDGFWISHLMVPWVHYEEVLERQRIYDLARFKNEVLGLPTTLGEHVVTRAEMEACCSDRPMAQSLRDIPAQGRRSLIAGLDWGGGGTSCTVLVIGFLRSDFKFQICRLERFRAREEPQRILNEVAQRCGQFGIRLIAADGGGSGHHLNRLLLDRLNRDFGLFAIFYSQVGQEPWQDGILTKWTVSRSATIGALFSRVKKKSLLFPRVEECGSFLDEFACEVAEYDDSNRTVKYSHPATQQDDALHATNYALQVAIYRHGQSQVWGIGDDAD